MRLLICVDLVWSWNKIKPSDLPVQSTCGSGGCPHHSLYDVQTIPSTSLSKVLSPDLQVQFSFVE